MKLNSLAKWALRKSLGTKRGEILLSLLEGPLGKVIASAAEGGSVPVSTLDALVAALEALREGHS